MGKQNGGYRKNAIGARIELELKRFTPTCNPKVLDTAAASNVCAPNRFTHGTSMSYLHFVSPFYITM